MGLYDKVKDYAFKPVTLALGLYLLNPANSEPKQINCLDFRDNKQQIYYNECGIPGINSENSQFDYFGYLTLKNGGTIDLFRGLIPYKGKEVLAIQKFCNRGGRFVVVPGYMVKKNVKIENSNKNHDSKIILQEAETEIIFKEIKKKDRSGLESLLRKHGFKGTITFW